MRVFIVSLLLVVPILCRPSFYSCDWSCLKAHKAGDAINTGSMPGRINTITDGTTAAGCVVSSNVPSSGFVDGTDYQVTVTSAASMSQKIASNAWSTETNTYTKVNTQSYDFKPDSSSPGTVEFRSLCGSSAAIHVSGLYSVQRSAVVSPTNAATPTVPPTTAPEICFEGYVMDTYCINLGRLLDNQSVKTLINPEEHSLHCLLDVPRCYGSGFEMLKEPPTSGGTYTREYKLDTNGNKLVLELGRATGDPDLGCTTCKKGGTLAKGFRATVFGTVSAPASGTTPATLAVTKVLPSAGGCSSTAAGPTAAAAPTAVATPTTAAAAPTAAAYNNVGSVFRPLSSMVIVSLVCFYQI